MFTKFGGVG